MDKHKWLEDWDQFWAYSNLMLAMGKYTFEMC